VGADAENWTLPVEDVSGVTGGGEFLNFLEEIREGRFFEKFLFLYESARNSFSEAKRSNFSFGRASY
jgi:hypothetical protein